MNKIIFVLLFLSVNTQIWCDDFSQIKLYEQIIENDCVVNIYNKDEYSFRIEIFNNLNQTMVETEWFSSRPLYGLGWLNNNLLRIDFGSGLSLNKYTYFYSKELHILSKQFSLATVVDDNNNLVLCADDYCIIYNIFFPERNYVLVNPNFYDGGGIPFFRIGRNTRFENGTLILEYYDKYHDLNKEIIYLENISKKNY